MTTAQFINRPDGAKIAYVIQGNLQGPSLVLSNSLATDREMWQWVLPQLSKDFRVITYDTRGHGQSTCEVKNIHLSVLADDALAVMDAAKADKAFFAGISLGGMTGLTLALSHPNRLLGLMACNCRGRIDQAGIDAWNQRIDVARASGMAALAQPTIARWFSKDYIDAQPVIMNAMAKIVANNSAAGFETCIRAIQQIALMDDLHKIEIPVLLLAGAQDQGAPPIEMELMAEQIKGSQLEVLDPCGHISSAQRPDDFVRILKKFTKI
ncbi:MAG: alpha/beta fold hydrolase [Burkholderiaceae bacterium]|jgi:3-oxoadipate enol-lactonase